MKNNEVRLKDYSFKNTENNIKSPSKKKDTPQRLRINQKLAAIKQTFSGGKFTAGDAAAAANTPKSN